LTAPPGRRMGKKEMKKGVRWKRRLNNFVSSGV
jgi:hypothetical protein